MLAPPIDLELVGFKKDTMASADPMFVSEVAGKNRVDDLFSDQHESYPELLQRESSNEG